MKNMSSESLADIVADIKRMRGKSAGLPHELFNLEQNLDKWTEDCRLPQCGTWQLGMNLNPADGHIMDYTTGWAGDENIGSSERALTADYLDMGVWARVDSNFVAIVRHQEGVVDAVKVFELREWGRSLSYWFKQMAPGRIIVSRGGPVFKSISPTAWGMEDDPIFSLGGDLAFNWAYSNNGARVVMTGGHLSGAGVNDDKVRGLGNHFECNPLLGTASASSTWRHEISNAQACREKCTFAQCQGTDHGTGNALKDGPVYGNYALFVSKEASSFPEPGATLELEFQWCD